MKDGETGFIVPKNDAEAFTQKLLLLTEDKKNREKMSQNGWTFVREAFHYERLVKDMATYYHELLKQRQK